jgi:hypothetical protein
LHCGSPIDSEGKIHHAFPIKASKVGVTMWHAASSEWHIGPPGHHRASEPGTRSQRSIGSCRAGAAAGRPSAPNAATPRPFARRAAWLARLPSQRRAPNTQLHSDGTSATLFRQALRSAKHVSAVVKRAPQAQCRHSFELPFTSGYLKPFGPFVGSRIN